MQLIILGRPVDWRVCNFDLRFGNNEKLTQVKLGDTPHHIQWAQMKLSREIFYLDSL